MSTSAPALHVAIRCDALAEQGTGHLIRQTALMQELLGRGHQVSLVGECDVDMARHQAAALGIDFLTPSDDFAAQAIELGANAAMIDGYSFPANMGQGCIDAGLATVAMVDDDFGRHQVADLYVDQNLGSHDPGGQTWLVGPKYVLLRDVVLRHRETPRPRNDPPRVLVVFGGSDPFGGAPVAVDLLARTEKPMHIVVIAANADRRAELDAVALRGQTLEVLGPQDDLPALAATCDFAVSAAGTTVWEFACLGIPTALVCVVDNQRSGYRAATQDVAVGVGELEQLRDDEMARAAAVNALRDMAGSASRRSELSECGRALVDGQGRARVVDALEYLVGLR